MSKSTERFLRSGLKLRHLHLVLALDEHRQIGKVAEVLHVTQPAVSKALAELEDGLSFRLFERRSRHIEPTAHGHVLIRHARSVVDQLRRAGEDLSAQEQATVHQLSVGVMHGLGLSLMADAISLARERLPQLQLAVTEDHSDRLIGPLRAGRVDLVLGSALSPRNAGDLEATPLCEDVMRLMVRVKHPLLRQRALSWEALLPYPWVLPLRTTKLRHSLDTALRRMQVEYPAHQFEALAVGLYYSLAQDIDAVAFVPARVGRWMESHGLCQALPLAVPGVVIPLVATRLKTAPPTQAAQVFLNSVERAAAM